MIVFLWAAWIFYITAFVINHFRVRIQRRGRPAERRVRRARLSEWGMLLQFAGILVAFALRRSWDEPEWLALAGIALAFLGVFVTWAALSRLGRQWRVAAVVTDDHELIVDGPYRVMRHPIYTGLFLMLLGTIFLITNWTAALVSAVLFFAGTELRIAAEERILSEHFSEAYASYRDRTSAWIPPFR